MGEYRVREVLGQGGFAFTYLAQDENLQKPFAIKEYFPVSLAVRDRDGRVAARSSEHQSELEYGLSRFLRESRVLARFHHPNIVQVLRFFEANGTAYIVMNFLEGEGLDLRLAREGGVRESELGGLLYPLLDGLEKVHDAGILHRDIKPSNVFIGRNGQPLLLDFGAARDTRRGRSSSVSTFVTHGYAPIEQYGDRGRQGPWTDIYALGAVLYEIITKDLPPDAPERALDDAYIPAVEAGKGRFRRDFLEAIDHSLRLRPEERPQTIREWRNEFLEAAAVAAQPPKLAAPTLSDPNSPVAGAAPGQAPSEAQPRKITSEQKGGRRTTQVHVGGVAYDLVDGDPAAKATPATDKAAPRTTDVDDGTVGAPIGAPASPADGLAATKIPAPSPAAAPTPARPSLPPPRPHTLMLSQPEVESAYASRSLPKPRSPPPPSRRPGSIPKAATRPRPVGARFSFAQRPMSPSAAPRWRSPR